MTVLEELLKKLLRDVALFVRTANGLKLRRYQEAVARAVVHSAMNGQGLSFVVIFPRQSGKNELQAQIQAYLLTLTCEVGQEMVQISPTWRPQTENAMFRLESVLSRNRIVKDRWAKHFGHVYQVGEARINFLSGSPTSNIVGATANLLLSIDEAQDIQIDKYDKEIAPMAASTNATRVFWGTAWTSNTLLAREEQAARAQQEQDGIQRVWRLTCDQVAQEVPPYAAFVAEQVAKLGRQHPMVKTQYYSEDIDAEGGLFPPERLALLYGTHPAYWQPDPKKIYAAALDLAGEDEQDNQDIEALAYPRSRKMRGFGGLPRRDSTALTIVEVDLNTLNDPGLLLPSYRVVYRQSWVGIKHTQLYGQLLNLATTWQLKYLVTDATGVGAGLTSFLARSLGDKVIPFIFNSRTKSDLAWSFLALIDSGRLQDYASPEDNTSLARLHELFFQQLTATQYEIAPGPDKKIKWAVPEGARDLASGELIHDDLVLSAALLAELDKQAWSITGPAAVVKAPDPLDDMKGF